MAGSRDNSGRAKRLDMGSLTDEGKYLRYVLKQDEETSENVVSLVSSRDTKLYVSNEAKIFCRLKY